MPNDTPFVLRDGTPREPRPAGNSRKVRHEPARSHGTVPRSPSLPMRYAAEINAKNLERFVAHAPDSPDVGAGGYWAAAFSRAEEGPKAANSRRANSRVTPTSHRGVSSSNRGGPPSYRATKSRRNAI